MIPSNAAWLVLALIGLAAAIALAGLNELTRERIDQEQTARAMSAVTGMLPADSYDNDLLDDSTTLSVSGFEREAVVYQARVAGEPVAAVVDVTTPRGYSGDIRLLIAVDVGGTVIGVDVLEHRETPGLGDRIESRRSDWLRQFVGRSLNDPEPEGWAPDRRGGEFDTLTSATITVDAVVDAVRRTLKELHSGDD
ncbi:RnfABCDGE type electron transport complex subunit G [Wenzhouxiangella sp. AB-CW3]|uniref:RnfABCDGE type electron transport complex subunit G n=1 Tax=Wenzhouxiangella sp. AB-CW3 TaxID=2771012 RepID=UPI00168C0002|nr:RnfABCDGE type electron transport complex subunit G [Wenzhouxiangella sp. AB-CW3]QOC21497.1 RnfABCDGE type electron transport complex subunit G [Wenzhouxiangella sp. AB-CW3]